MNGPRIGSSVREALDKRVRWTINLIDDRLGRRPVTIHDRLDDLERFTRATLQAQGWRDGERLGERIAELSAARAAYLNWADGPDGYAAQAGLWFNPPVPIELRPGSAGVLLVNERIVEHPWVFSTLGAGGPLRIADVGGSESTVALSLASLGHHVEVIDPRGYPVEHPNLTAWPCRLEDYEGEGAWDVCLCLSAVEHFGLEHYGQATSTTRADIAAVASMQDHVAPDGRLLLTVPYGPAFEVAGFERIYDAEALDALLGTWRVLSSTVVERTSRTTWEPLADRGRVQGRAVAMVEAALGASGGST